MTRTARTVFAALALAVTAITATGCAEPRSLLVSRPPDRGTDLAVTALLPEPSSVYCALTRTLSL